MTLQQVQMAIANLKKGRMVKVHYQTIKGDYRKETKTIVRFVEYSHIKGVVVKGKKNPNEKDIVPTFVIFNQNTGEYYLQMATIETKTKPTIDYYYKDQPITKANYDMANPPKPSNKPLVVFRKNIKDIISIG